MAWKRSTATKVSLASVTVDVEVFAERHPENPVVVKVTEAKLTFVAVERFQATRESAGG